MFTRIMRRARRRKTIIGSFASDERASVAIIAAIALPVVIGGMGLGAETGYWYLTQRKLQHAADVSAHAAGVRKRAGDAQTQINAAAMITATNTGFAPSVGTLVVNIPPLSGGRVGQTDSVEVIVTHTHARLFSAIFNKEPVMIRGRAVARLYPGSGQACVLALAPVARGAVTVTGSTEVKLDGCHVHANSNAADAFLLSGSSASISTGCVGVVGQSVANTQLTLTECQQVREFAPAVSDPYSSVPEPDLSSIGCEKNGNVGNPGGSSTLAPTQTLAKGVKAMRFCSGLDLKGIVNLQPGIYIIEGNGLGINGGATSSTSTVQINGVGVTFYFTGANSTVNLNGRATLNLSAPTSGPYSGILFFGSRTSVGATQKINGSSTSILQGAIYMPRSAIVFNGNSAASGGCTQVIGGNIEFSGNSAIGSECQNAGTQPIFTHTSVALVE